MEVHMPITDLLPWNRERSKYELQRRGERSLWDMQRDMNEIFNNFFANPFSIAPMQRMMEMGESYSPGIDVCETDKEIIITADLPGMDEKNIHLTIEGDVLTISGTKEKETETKEARIYRKERSYGSFSRSITLPGEVDIEKVDASFNKGVLKVSVPKLMEASSTVRKIPIRSE
jgi:HSP20 family protein